MWISIACILPADWHATAMPVIVSGLTVTWSCPIWLSDAHHFWTMDFSLIICLYSKTPLMATSCSGNIACNGNQMTWYGLTRIVTHRGETLYWQLPCILYWQLFRLTRQYKPHLVMATTIETDQIFLETRTIYPLRRRPVVCSVYRVSSLIERQCKLPGLESYHHLPM